MADGDQQQQQNNQQQNNQQQQQAPWHQGIDAEIIGHAQNKGWKLDDAKTAFATAAAEHRKLQSHFGVPADRLLKLPEKNDAPEWGDVYARLGVPKDAKEYDFAGVKFKDGTDLEAGFVDKMRAALHRARVPKDHAASVVKDVVDYLDVGDAAEAAERAAKIAADKAELRKNWGANFDFNHLKAMEGARRLGISPEAVNRLENEIGYSAVMEAMRKIGTIASEDIFVEGGKGGSNPTTLDGAHARKAELMSDSGWVERYNKGGAAEVREMRALNMIIAAAMPAA